MSIIPTPPQGGKPAAHDGWESAWREQGCPTLAPDPQWWEDYRAWSRPGATAPHAQQPRMAPPAPSVPPHVALFRRLVEGDRDLGRLLNYVGDPIPAEPDPAEVLRMVRLLVSPRWRAVLQQLLMDILAEQIAHPRGEGGSGTNLRDIIEACRRRPDQARALRRALQDAEQRERR